MALRSLGSSLVAKATPGSASRDLLQAQMSKPAIPGKGEIGTTNRDLASPTEITSAAPGSEKIIAAGPGVEGSQIMSPTEGQPTAPMQPLLAGGMGLPQGPGNVGTNPMAMMDTNAARVSASAPTAGGKSAMASSLGGQSGDVRASGYIPAEVTSSVGVQADRPQNNPIIESFTSRLLGGNKSYAAEESRKTTSPNTQYPTAQRNFSQGVAQTLASAISGKNANASYGGGPVDTRNKTAMNLVRYANNPVITGSGIGSITDATSRLRSMATNAKNTVLSKLRSLFGKR